MRNGFFLVVLFFILGDVVAQNTTSTIRTQASLKLENERLKKELEILKSRIDVRTDTSVAVSNFFREDIKFNFISCVGNKATKKVIVRYKCSSSVETPPQELKFYVSSSSVAAVDENDRVYRIEEGELDKKKNDGTLFAKNTVLLPTNATVFGTMLIKNVDPEKVRGFKLVTMFFSTHDREGDNKDKGTVEFSGIKIDWK